MFQISLRAEIKRFFFNNVSCDYGYGYIDQIIDAIAGAVRATPGAVLLDVDPGQSTNRTVFTFVGDPDSIVQAALNAAKVAFSLIDMRKHSGEHPR